MTSIRSILESRIDNPIINKKDDEICKCTFPIYNTDKFGNNICIECGLYHRCNITESHCDFCQTKINDKFRKRLKLLTEYQTKNKSETLIQVQPKTIYYANENTILEYMSEVFTDKCKWFNFIKHIVYKLIDRLNDSDLNNIITTPYINERRTIEILLYFKNNTQFSFENKMVYLAMPAIYIDKIENLITNLKNKHHLSFATSSTLTIYEHITIILSEYNIVNDYIVKYIANI